jgi:hypothetical protein
MMPKCEFYDSKNIKNMMIIKLDLLFMSLFFTIISIKMDLLLFMSFFIIIYIKMV